MREFDYENPFNSENLWMDYDPMYAMTADYIDQFGTVEYQQTTDLEPFVEAFWLPAYQRILQENTQYRTDTGDIGMIRFAVIGFPVHDRMACHTDFVCELLLCESFSLARLFENVSKLDFFHRSRKSNNVSLLGDDLDVRTFIRTHGVPPEGCQSMQLLCILYL